MANESNNSFSVLDMAAKYANSTGTDVSELFKSPAAPKTVQPAVPSPADAIKPAEPETPTTGGAWVPDKKTIGGLPELQNQSTGMVFSKEEYKEDGEESALVNQLDDEALQDSMNQLDSMQRQQANIELLKKRHGVQHFHIPPGPYQVRMTAAAGNPDVKEAQAALDVIFEELSKEAPDAIEYINQKAPVENSSTAVASEDAHEQVTEAPNPDDADVQIRIDKTHVPYLRFSDEELKKIRVSRKIELDIVEGQDIDYASIENADENLLDIALAPYRRKSNDIEAALPASNYRGVFTGLTYPEVMDLKAASEISGIDAEYKKWSIAFDHLKNPSIGPFEDYRWYIDPDTNRTVKMTMTEKAPATLGENVVIHTCSKFEDFLRKTSFLDLEYMLWKILCATSTDKELLNIVCHAPHNGQPCNQSYDWVYNPAELIDPESVSAIALEAMEKTTSVSSKEDIIANYNESMLVKQNTVLLPTSGMRVVFGHVSAYEYLTSHFSKWEELNDIPKDEPAPPDYASRMMIYTIATTIKAFLLPTADGKWKKTSGTDNVIYIMNQMDVVDLSVLANLAQMMTEPYQMTFSLKQVKCPHCKNVRDISIKNIQDMLFILARSLANVNVILKRT